MGLCQSIIIEDEDDKIIRIRNEQQKKELYEFQQQLRKENKHYLKNLPKDFSMSKAKIY